MPSIAGIQSIAGGSGPQVIDSYALSNRSAEVPVTLSNRTGISQSFTGTTATIGSCDVLLYESGLTTGSLSVRIYAHSGTFGTSSVPTGSALAVSDSISMNQIAGAFTRYRFIFSGANQIMLSAINYVLTIEGSAVQASGEIYAGTDITSPTHSGNFGFNSMPAGTWTANTVYDLCFVLNDNTQPLTIAF